MKKDFRREKKQAGRATTAIMVAFTMLILSVATFSDTFYDPILMKLRSTDPNIGAVSTILRTNLDPHRAVISNSLGKLAESDVSDTELGYLSGTTSSIQSQLNSKSPVVTGAATTVISNNLTANRATISNSLGKLAASDTTDTEIGYVSGVTSPVQTQLNGKVISPANNTDGKIPRWNGTDSKTLSDGINYSTVIASDAADSEMTSSLGVKTYVDNGLSTKQATITGGITSGISANYNPHKALVTDGNGKIIESDTADSQISYLNTTSSNIQTQIDSKQATITGAASTATSSNFTINRAVISNGSGKLAESATTDTEISYVHGVTSAIQTQLDAKVILVGTCNGRLTLESGVPVSTTDQTAKTTLYFTPYNGDKIALYDGSSTWSVYTLTEKSLDISGYTANKNYDIFIYNNSGTLTLNSEIWTDNTTRATALTTQNGIYVKTGATTHRFIGTIRITGTTGQCEDSLARRFVWNMYNRESRPGNSYNSNASWTYSTATHREYNNGTGQVRFEFVVGLGYLGLPHVSTDGEITGNTAIASFSVCIDSTTTNFLCYCTVYNGGVLHKYTMPYIGIPIAIGYHYCTQVEYGGADATILGGTTRKAYITVNQ